jgi:hypothetical protein
MRFFLDLWPANWWSLVFSDADPSMWALAPAVSPYGLLLSIIVLAASTVLRTPRFSLLCIIAHVLACIPHAIEIPSTIVRSGFHWMAIDLLDLHMVWISLLFAWLHWLNVTRDMEDGTAAAKGA